MDNKKDNMASSIEIDDYGISIKNEVSEITKLKEDIEVLRNNNIELLNIKNEYMEKIEKINSEIWKLKNTEMTILQAIHKLIILSKGERENN